MTVYLSVAELIQINLEMVEEWGGSAGVRDQGALEAAVARPQIGYYSDLIEEAAALCESLLQNHPFIDGNKRAATAALIAFLSDNGWTFDASADEAEPVILQLADGSLDKSQFTDWARKHMHEKPKMELRDFFATLKYQTITECLHAGLVHDNPDLAQKERFDTITEAAKAIPAIDEANLGAMHAEREGNVEATTILRGQSHLLTAIYRIAQDMGYEW